MPLSTLRLGSHRPPTPSTLALWFERHPGELTHSRDIARSYQRPLRVVQRALTAFAGAGHCALVVDKLEGEGWAWVDSASPAQVGERRGLTRLHFSDCCTGMDTRRPGWCGDINGPGLDPDVP